ncbi:uncharacterized protein BO97DRAFT_415089 [Aspergillus homomorphus CBS 101889]|uniref:Peptidase S64 n=1 Tax=Aspergillus homomorphus (strain CBS 101889) TaxID=1450537 RepID=A0A395HVT2_ASPHC|nr:hypothetical protein BO97DRAFT_415089 [Aspergillus homomorphus CBS 101889]RAL11505.1 hypothetical protein BO97DRAFT_415089 [Aspergillus homomorphus CBS 101889]
MALVANPLICPPSELEITYASPVYRRSSDSQSVRSCRTNRSSSDSSTRDGDGFVEEDLRAGGPYLPEPPCLTFYPRQHDPFLQKHQKMPLVEGILNLAKNNQINVIEVEFCYRSSEHDPSGAKKLTCKLIAQKQDPKEVWVGFARTVLGFLHQRGVTNIVVEIIDPLFHKTLVYAPCSPSDPIFSDWNKVRASIEQQIPLRGINVISCHRIGTSRDRASCPPMVIVGVDPHELRDWRRTRDDVLAILKTFGHSQVGVLIRKEFFMPMCSCEDKGPKMDRITANGAARIGMSLSLSDEKDNRGTLGGYIEIQNPKTKKWLPMALTCMHCVLPTQEQTKIAPDRKTVYDGFRKNGIRMDDDKSLLLMHSPAVSEVLETIEELKEGIQGHLNDNTYKLVELQKQRNEFVLPHHEKSWARLKGELRVKHVKLEKVLKAQRENEYVLGSVFAGSGLKTKQLSTIKSQDPTSKHPSIVDWALIQINHRAPGDNTSSDLKLEAGRLAEFEEGVSPGYEATLLKLGHKTGFTTGKYNPLMDCRVARNPETNEVILTLEHSIVSLGEKHGVIGPGDSGALVYDSKARVWGMCFGGADNGTRAYFTHISDLLADIKSTLGVTEIRLVE